MWNCRPGPTRTVDGYKSSMALQKFLLCIFKIKYMLTILHVHMNICDPTILIYDGFTFIWSHEAELFNM